MTIATDWQSNTLYPGGQAVWDSGSSLWDTFDYLVADTIGDVMETESIPIGCRVGTEDLYPSDPWVVNVSMSDLHKWLWNLEDWSVSLECASVVKDDPSDTEYMDFDLSISGQFHDGYFDHGDSGYFTIRGDCLDTPPKNRICGKHYRTTETDAGGPTNSTVTHETVLPSAFVSVYHAGGETAPYTKSDAINISDGASTVGDVSASGTLDNFGFLESAGAASMDFKYIRLLGDGTADVHFIADAYGDYSAGLVGITRMSPNNDPLTTETATAYTISVLGSSVTAYVMTQRDIFSGGLEASGPTPTSFSYTYAITTTTAYTY